MTTSVTQHSTAQNDHPFFSVALPAYNAAATLPRAIESVVAQTVDAWELVLVDDGSTDETAAVATRYAERDARIRVVRQPNSGCGAARNAAIEHACGDWIVRLDADDELLPTYLERLSTIIAQHPEAELVSPSGFVQDADGNESPWCPDSRYQTAFALTLDDALHGWCPLFTHSAFRRALWVRVGGIRADVYAEDYDFWARALASGARGWYAPETLSIYAVGRSSQMSERTNLIAASYLRTLEEILANHSLEPEDRSAVERRVAALRRRVRVRTLAARFLGPRTAERLVGLVTEAVGRARKQTGR